MDIDNSVQQAFDGFFGFLPNLLGFIVILIIGFVVAKIAQAVTRMLEIACDEIGPDEDLTTVVQPVERRAGVEVRAPRAGEPLPK